MLLDFIHRGVYIGAFIFFIMVGFVLIIIGNPEYLQSLVSEGMFDAIYTSTELKINVVSVSIGVGMVIFSTIVGLAGGFVCRFSKKAIIPKNVDVLRSQDVAVFLVDGKVYKKTEAVFYNLAELSRLRVVKIRNLYLMELEEDITIAPKEDKINENTILHRDNEEDNGKGSDARSEEGEDNDKPFK
jgi:hypothetical protein